MPELAIPHWFSALTRGDMADLLANPHRKLSTCVVDRIAGREGLRQVNPQNQMGTGERVQFLSLLQIKDVENLKAAFDEWWNDLPSDAKHAFKNPCPPGRVPGKYREHLWDVDPNGETDDELPLQAPVRLPGHVLGYLTFQNRACG